MRVRNVLSSIPQLSNSDSNTNDDVTNMTKLESSHVELISSCLIMSVYGQDVSSLVLWVTILGVMTSPVCFAQVRMQQSWLE